MSSKTPAKIGKELDEESIEEAHKAAESGNVFEIEELKRELDQAFAGILNSEITELERLSSFTENVQEKMSKHYAKIFPKRCNSCGTIYHSREEFLKATNSMATTDTVFDEIGLQEYRNCPCGSTLILWTRDRRDNSEYGRGRRELFDYCLRKLSKVTGQPEEDLVELLRKVFSAIS